MTKLAFGVSFAEPFRRQRPAKADAAQENKVLLIFPDGIGNRAHPLFSEEKK